MEVEDSNDSLVIIDDETSETNSTTSGTGSNDKNKDEGTSRLDQDATDMKNDEMNAATLELKKLSMDRHGTFMVDFDPEKSKRELRKMNRRINSKGSKKNQLYDERGILIEAPMDLCDCLDKNCPGCHFPCAKCGSEKCGTDCRCNRKYVIDLIEVEGFDTVFSFPSNRNLPAMP